jgi:hypothetical protein
MEQQEQKLELKDEMRNVVEEARMVLPGIQALFGFQTIAVFNQRFDDLPDPGKLAHYVALCLGVLAIALVMTPAAYHRMLDSSRVTRALVRRSSRLICLSLAPLACSLALDLFVVLLLGTGEMRTAAWTGGVTLALLLACWFAYPWLGSRLRRD